MTGSKAQLFLTATIVALLATTSTDAGNSRPGSFQAEPAFVQQAYLKASNTAAQDRFGFSVAMSGNTAVVGAPLQSTDAAGNRTAIVASSGAAYVFVRSEAPDGREVWIQQQFLKASNANVADNFGRAVAISGDTIVVGAPAAGTPTSTGTMGAAYVFVRNGTTWTQQAQLNASHLQSGAQFGFSVAVSGDTIVVGAHQEDRVGADPSDTSAFDEGAAYVFVRRNTPGDVPVWTEQAHLKASNPEALDFFGFSVGISGDTVVVGACQEDSNAKGIDGDQANNSANLAGAAYVFRRDGESWSQQSYLKASNTRGGDLFGYSVAMSGDTVVVGARLEAGKATGVNGDQTNNLVGSAGAVYVFVASGNSWIQQAYLKASNTPQSGVGDQFGYAVAVSGNVIAVSAVEEDSGASGVDGNQADNSLTGAGAAYVFVRSCGAWQQRAYLKASNPGFDDSFGGSVAVSGDAVLIGAHLEDGNATGINGGDNNSATEAGAAYAFSMSNTAPAMTSLPISRWPGTSGDFAIAVVNDDEEGPCALAVSIQSPNPSNGVTLTGLSNTGGSVTARVDVAPGASSASFVLRVTDLAGAFTETPFNVTVVPPVTITPSISPAANANGWHRQQVEVTWSVTNSTFQSGCSETDLVTQSPAAGTTLTCTAGNDGGTTSVPVTIRIDLTPPTGTASRTPLPNANGWSNTDVTVTFECNDALSGPPAAMSLQTITADGFNQSRSAVCTDLAGNTLPVSISGISIDKTPPTVTPTSIVATPNPATVNAPISLAATLIDTGFSNLSRAEFAVGAATYVLPAANASAIVTGTIGAFATPAVLNACVRAFDRAGNQSPDACAPITVFDPSAGVQVQPGEVLVVDPDAGTSNIGTLFRIDPETGRRLVLTDFGRESGVGQDPRWIAIDRYGRVLLIDQSAGTNGWGALKRIDPRTTDAGTLRPRVEVISDFGDETQGPPGGNPQGVAIEADGHILVVDAGAATAPPTTARPPRLFRIDPMTGQRGVVSEFGVNSGAQTAIAVERDGRILVLDQAGNPRLLRIDPSTGSQTVLTVLNQNPNPALAPRGIAVEASGSILVAEIATGINQRGALFRVSPVDGSRVILSDFNNASQGALAENPQQVAVAPDGRIYVTDAFAGTGGTGSLFRVDPVSGNRVLLTDFGDAAPGGLNPFGVAVVPSPPGTLIVVKDVRNDSGGTRVASDWTMTVTGGRPDPATFAGAASPGRTVLVDAGSYSVTELGPSGYSTPTAGCSGTIAAGETKTCTITSDDLPATLIVIKSVVNDNGGSRVAADWRFTVTGANPSPATFQGAGSPGTAVRLDAGAYDVSEAAPSGYSTTRSGACTGAIAIGEVRTCTSISDDLDLTTPDTTITSSPPPTTTGTTATFAFSATEAGTFNCSLDGAAFVTCTSPQTYSSLSLGTHTFAVRAIDDAGNADPTPASYSWTVQQVQVLVTLTVTKAGTGQGTVASIPSGIDCGSACTASFAQDASVTLSARSNTGSTFGGWAGAADCTDGVVKMSSDLTCTATFTMADPPDLTVSSLMIQGPKNIAAGSALQITSTITNAAAGTAAPSSVSFYLSSNSTFEAASDQLLGFRGVPQLAAKATSSATTSVTLPPLLAPGDWYIVAVVDVSGSVAESNETNNALSRSFKIKK